MIEKIISSKGNFEKFANSLVKKAFLDRCNKYGHEFDGRVEKMAEIVADHYVDKFFPFTGKYAEDNFFIFLSMFNYYNGWDQVEAASRIMPGIEDFLEFVEPEDEFKRLHGCHMNSIQTSKEIDEEVSHALQTIQH